MTVKEVLQELASYGNEGTKNILIKHGAKEPFFGVKVQDLKKIQKKVKKDHQLALALFDTGNSDAMYLAGLIADEEKMTKVDLNKWAKEAYWYFLSEYAVAWVTAESKYGFELGLDWIKSDKENIASCGWSTLANISIIKPDSDLDIATYEKLLTQVEKRVHNAQNRVRYTMNGFVISVGTRIVDLTEKAIKIADKIGKVDVEMGGTACKVPLASEYIQKVIDKNQLGKKKKMARC